MDEQIIKETVKGIDEKGVIYPFNHLFKNI